MKLYSENKEYKLYNGNMLDMLEVIEPNSIDSIITDPPYELNFMNKGWDNSGIAFQKDAWKKCYEVLKPGGYLLAFGGSRTFHRIACAIEDAGFEIRDTIMWLYGSGFPKSMNIGLAIDKRNGVESIDTGIQSPNARPNSDKSNTLYESGTVGKDFTIKKATNEWGGWGTCLKPAYEPIIVARKPVENSIIDNVMKYGVGGINIDECRVPFEDTSNPATNPLYRLQANYKLPEKQLKSNGAVGFTSSKNDTNPNGRFPANVILTYDENDYEEVCGSMPDSKGASSQNNYSNGHIYRGQSLQESNTSLNGYREWYNDEGSASRYFYCAKASKFDRDEGLDEFEEKKCSMLASNDNIDKDGNFTGMLAGRNTVKRNVHPTVKPTELMRYLVRLVSPKGATILDCFNGSGSTGKAVMLENKQYNKDYKYIGIELTNEYLPIAKARIEYICDNEFEFKDDKRKPLTNNVKKVEVVDDSLKEIKLW